MILNQSRYLNFYEMSISKNFEKWQKIKEQALFLFKAQSGLFFIK